MTNFSIVKAVKENNYSAFYDYLEDEKTCQYAQEKLFQLFTDTIEKNKESDLLVSILLCYGAAMFTEGKQFMERIKGGK